METHANHLHKAPGNRIWHYFYEFIMLFLAVFCGFLAEFQLEHKIERERAKDLAHDFYKELKNDSINLAKAVTKRQKRDASLTYLMKYLQDSSLEKLSKIFVVNFYNGTMSRIPSTFVPRTIVLEQLKNSGSFRYFKNDELQDQIGNLSVVITKITDRQGLEASFRLNTIDQIFTIQHYDFDFDDELTHNGELAGDQAIDLYERSADIIPFKFKGNDAIDRRTAINTLGVFRRLSRSTLQNFYEPYAVINSELLRLLRKEYHLIN